MSGAGASLLKADGSGLRVAIVASTWHEEIMNGLIDGASRACAEAGVEATLIRVAGSFELPIVAQACARSDFDAIIALGVISRGDTPHFEFVSDAATTGLLRVSLDTGIPIGFGLLTCDTERQALDRAGLPGSVEDKGAEATWAAVTTAVTLGDLRTP